MDQQSFSAYVSHSLNFSYSVSTKSENVTNKLNEGGMLDGAKQAEGWSFIYKPPPGRGEVFTRVIHHKQGFLYFVIWCYLGRGLCPALAAVLPCSMMDRA